MKKQEYQLQLYKEQDVKRIYFITGAGLVMGSILGGMQGILASLRNTRGKKKGMAYFVAQHAQRVGRATATASYAFAASEYLLSKITWHPSSLYRMIE
ncbi:hypothetical protein NEIRO03_1640 [Nematocida sp. AWRm78]|nr:hypothetical protein NEIRO02_1617 [Nematocida sp. AWRm79]KAI5184186.1 hypothetical protein NEIRO03_1640 [Nematocida sp. AWRm78]